MDPAELHTQKTPNPSAYKFNPAMAFGTQFSDHILTADWDSQHGWGRPQIQPFCDLKLHPASSCLHYGLQAFEGAKAFRGVDGKIRLKKMFLNLC